MEEWRSVPLWPSYEASSLGNIRSKDRVVSYVDGRKRFYPSVVLRPWLDSNGYKIVELCKGKQEKYYKSVHSLVCSTFCGLCPAGLQCRHLDGDKENNIANNLCWGTSKENGADKVRHGTSASKYKGQKIENKGHIENCRLSAKKRWSDPDERRRQSARIKSTWEGRKNEIRQISDDSCTAD